MGQNYRCLRKIMWIINITSWCFPLLELPSSCLAQVIRLHEIGNTRKEARNIWEHDDIHYQRVVAWLLCILSYHVLLHCPFARTLQGCIQSTTALQLYPSRTSQTDILVFIISVLKLFGSLRQRPLCRERTYIQQSYALLHFHLDCSRLYCLPLLRCAICKKAWQEGKAGS